ncbi:hypothetical protein Tco_0243348 [Tanacetum coccineum]
MVFTNEWDLSSLAFFQETEGPYNTDLYTPDEIQQFLRFERVDSNRTIKNKLVTLTPNQVLTKEVREYLKHWEELIRENAFSLGGHQDHLLASLRQTRRPRSDCGIQKACHSVSSSSTHHFGSSSHQEDDDNNKGTSRAASTTPMTSTKASTSKPSKRPKINIIPPRQLFVDLTQDDTKTPSPTHHSSSPSAPNAPSKTPSTRATSSSSITSKLKSPSSFTSPSTNGYLNSPSSPPPRVPPPHPTQENELMDITLTLSPITPLDIQFNTPSHSMPLPPFFGHPIP